MTSHLTSAVAAEQRHDLHVRAARARLAKPPERATRFAARMPRLRRRAAVA